MSPTPTAFSDSPRRALVRLAIAYAAFIALGLFSGFLGPAWKSLRADFNQPVEALGFLILTMMLGYIAASIANGAILARTSLASLILIALGLRVVGLFTQSVSTTWSLFGVAIVCYGLGGGLLDAGLNTYAAAHFRPRWMNWLHACFGIGTTLGAALITGLLSAGLSWRIGLATIGSVHLALMVLFLATRRAWVMQPAAEARSTTAEPSPSTRATLRLPIVVLSLALFFVYTGVEMGFGQWGATLLTEVRGLSAARAGLATSLFWGSLTVGRIVLGLIETRLVRLLRWSLLGVLVAAGLLAIPGNGLLGPLALALAGFALAPIFPVLMTLTPGRVGLLHAANAIGGQVAAAGLGGALLPALIGLIGRLAGLPSIAWVLLVGAALLAALHEAVVWAGRKR